MKKRLILSILVCAVLLLVPSSALASEGAGRVPQSFSVTAGADNLWIEVPGDVVPAGNSGRWIIHDRTIVADLFGGIDGTFTFVYHGIVESTETQAGTMQGVVKISDAAIVGVCEEIDISGVLIGRSNGIEFAGWLVPNVVPLYTLSFGGKIVFQDGIQGVGELNASFTFVPTPEGHVALLVGGEVALEVQWH